ncbi:MAG: HD domain-containing phosphohydrolase [Actinomycetota bacterium]
MSTPARSIDEIRWRRWPERRWASRFVRFAMIALPLVAGLAAGLVWQATVDVGSGLTGRVPWLVGFVGVTILGYVLTERLMRRFAPLATLLRMSLAFPDRLPSRYGVALRAGSSANLARRIAEEDFADREDAEVAEAVLTYGLALSRHDRLTRGHGERVRSYSEVIGREMGLSEDDLDRLRWSGLLHDIGKLMVPGELLNKPDSLTAEEYELVQAHAAAGAAIAEPLRPWLGEWVDAVGQHHERWDGAGYPTGLRGEEISLGARIVAVADVFDVMTSVRSYRPAVSADEAREEIVRCGGTQFDPAVVAAFVRAGLTSPWRLGAPLLALLSLPGLRQLAGAGQSGGSAVAAGAAVASLATALGLVLVPAEEDPEPVALPPTTTTPPPPPVTTTTSPPATTAPPPPPATTTTTTTEVVPAPQAAPATTTTTTTAPATTTTTTEPPPSTTTTTELVLVLADLPLAGDEDQIIVEQIEAPDGATFEVLGTSPLGTVTVDPDGVLTFVPVPDASGSTELQVEVCVGDVCDVVTVTVDLAAVPDAPVAADDEVTERAGFPLVIDVLGNDTDADGDQLTVRLVAPVADGVTTDGTSITVATTIGERRDEVIAYEAVDPTGLAAPGSLRVIAEPGVVVAVAAGPDRSTPAPLDGAVVTDEIFVFVDGDPDIDRVDFHLDDPDRLEPPLVRELFPPFDLGTSDPSTGLARPFDVSQLDPGPHRLTIVVVFDGRDDEIIDVGFEVIAPPPAEGEVQPPVEEGVEGPLLDEGEVQPPVEEEVGGPLQDEGGPEADAVVGE